MWFPLVSSLVLREQWNAFPFLPTLGRVLMLSPWETSHFARQASVLLPSQALIPGVWLHTPLLSTMEVSVSCFNLPDSPFLTSPESLASLEVVVRKWKVWLTWGGASCKYRKNKDKEAIKQAKFWRLLPIQLYGIQIFHSAHAALIRNYLEMIWAAICLLHRRH